MTLIIDLDHTLLNTTALKRKMEEALALLGVSGAVCRETYQETVTALKGRYDYTLRRHAGLVALRTGIDEEVCVNALEQSLATPASCLYPDALPFLERMKARGFSLVLLTFGNALFQRTKIERLGIAPYFDHLLCTDEPKETVTLPIEGTPDSFVYINDNPIELRALRARMPDATFLRIKRPDGKTFSEEDDALDVPTFSSLDEISL